MTPTSVGMRCPECTRQKTRVVRRGYAGSDPVVTYGLIIVNVLAFFGEVATGAGLGGGGAIGGADSVLAKAALNGPAVANGDVWRIFTAGFMHYGLFHLLVNMYSLYILGSLLEPSIGSLRFAIIYAVSLVGGSFGALLISPDALTAGASGAVFGLLAASIVVLRSRGISAMESGLGIWLIINLAFSFTAHVSLGGHLGGLVAGGLCAWIMTTGARLRMPRWAPLAASALLGVAAFAGAVAIA
jgi:membrane associated rhomboid family serine protease